MGQNRKMGQDRQTGQDCQMGQTASEVPGKQKLSKLFLHLFGKLVKVKILSNKNVKKLHSRTENLGLK